MTSEPIRIVEEAPTAELLAAYADVPIAFRVESILRPELIESGLGGVRLVEEPVEPYIKDYDFEENEGPMRWLRWVTPQSCLLFAYSGAERVGEAALMTHVEGMMFLRGRTDTVGLWDIRVAPRWRGEGVGTHLFLAAVAWAKRYGYVRIKIETQNINVNACRFYASQGCYLGGIERHAYTDFQQEVELIWYYDIASS